MDDVGQDSRYLTAAELLEDLGGVAPDRVRIVPAPGAATERELVWLRDHEDRLFELVDGTLVEKAYWFYGSVLTAGLAQHLGKHVESGRLGVLVGPDAAYRLRPGLVRSPSLSYVSWDRLPDKRIPRVDVAPFSPELAVEMVNPGNTEAEMARKVREYFAAGARLVWLIDARARTARIFSDPQAFEVLDDQGALDGGDVLPGFRVSLSDLFERAKRSRTRRNQS